MEKQGLVPDNVHAPMVTENGERVESALSDIMEESTVSSSEVPPDDPHAEPPTIAGNQSTSTQTSSTGNSTTLDEAVQSITELIRSKFVELDRTLTQHCRRTHRMLNRIQVRINAYLRQQRPADDRNTRSSRLANLRSQYHPRPMSQRASAPRTQRSAAQRPGPPRSSPLGIAGQRSSVTRRRLTRPLTHQARDNPGFSRSGRTGTFRTTPFNLRNASSL